PCKPSRAPSLAGSLAQPRNGRTGMAGRVSGRSIPRLEDRRLLTGGGRYTADLRPEGAAHAVFLRSPHAHAAIAGIDTAAARSAPGVLAVLTAAEAAADGLGRLRCERELPGHSFVDPLRPVLAEGRVRFVGEAVAVV